MKKLFITEKPSVAQEFAKALKVNQISSKKDGYIERDNIIITWCVGHLVTMSYPDKYDEKLKFWNLNTLPFFPKEFKYEVIDDVKKQFEIVKWLLNRKDVSIIYVCTDSGREGEYIYRLVRQMAEVKDKEERRVWIDSQTEEEIIRGIKSAKLLSEYDNLANSAYLRAKEDYLMGINFSRALTLKFGGVLGRYLKYGKNIPILSGRVMTCILGMVVRREREIRAFVKVAFFRVISKIDLMESEFEAEWRVSESSKYYNTPYLYKENGFKEEKYAKELINYLSEDTPIIAKVVSKNSKVEKKNPPLLYNLAELQNDCSKIFKISPDTTLKIIQELYEKKLVTYPRTDARVLSTAIAKTINKTIQGLQNYNLVSNIANEILNNNLYANIQKTKYVNDSQITDHYAIIPTGQGFNNLKSLSPISLKIYELIVRRFLSIFYPPAEYLKFSLVLDIKNEKFYVNFKLLQKEGYLKVIKNSFNKKKDNKDKENDTNNEITEQICDINLLNKLKSLKKDASLKVNEFFIKEGETTPPKRYTSGSMILALENAGQLIEDEELRAKIKSCGIGTSATRAGILKKLADKEYISINNKNQIITPTQIGEMINDVTYTSIKALLIPELTASWEKGLELVANGSITINEYMQKLEKFVNTKVQNVKNLNNEEILIKQFKKIEENYKNLNNKEKK